MEVQGQSSRALFGLSMADLRAVMAEFGEKPYRAAQVAQALYGQRVESLEELTTLPADLRARMVAAGWLVGLPVLRQTTKSVDGTERYLVELADGETVETVWMPNGDSLSETDEDGYQRATICVSSQVGCAVNCQFCLTAKLGIRRNLTAGEIAGQVAAVLSRHDVHVGSARGNGRPDRINLVFMGMGEPFLNYDNFFAAFGILREQMKIPESRMTVSTSGILPGLERFAKEPVRPNLALSLNASNDAVRDTIMPITRKWGIGALLDALRAIPMRPREWVTFEYVLLGGVNDAPEHADEVIALLRGMQAKINLIVWNAGPNMPFQAPPPERVTLFQKRLIAAGVQAYIRRPRGADIYAACGQLKRTVEAESAAALVTIGSVT